MEQLGSHWTDFHEILYVRFTKHHEVHNGHVVAKKPRNEKSHSATLTAYNLPFLRYM
jgi:hypothetical protein